MLAEAGYDFEVDPSDVDEPDPAPGDDPAAYVGEPRLAQGAGRRRRGAGEGLILAADTVGAVDGLILNKPVDRDDAERMIRLQEGRESDVLTGLCLFRADRLEWVGAVETSVVRFRDLSDAERTDTSIPAAGKGRPAATACRTATRSSRSVSGTLSNVVGLPMERLDALLRGHPGLTG